MKSKHRETGLAFGAAQASAELLQKDKRAFRGTQEEHGVNLRHIDAFVEEVDAKHHPHLAVPKVPQRSLTFISRRVRRYG